MGLRQREWAKRKREELLVLLGGKCVDCGTTKDLEFDCIEPRGHHHHRSIGRDCRIRFYLKEHAAGNLTIRCKRHNAIKGRRADKEFYDKNPF